MRLIDVFDGDSESVKHGDDFDELEIRGITCDSRRVEPGFLFAALPGTTVDGRRFIGEAIARGAPVVLAPEGTDEAFDTEGAFLLTDANPRRAYARAAARFYGAQPETVVAVTGTNGKTSVVSFLRQIWNGLGHRAASAGTLGVRVTEANGSSIASLERDSSLTTPDPVDLHRDLARLAEQGIDRLAIEASSHGLDQYRLDGLRPKAAAFTNLSRDHLDYHGTREAYQAAKLRLFTDLLDDRGCAVVNADDPGVEVFRAAAAARKIRTVDFGHKARQVRILETAARPTGQSIAVEVAGRRFEIGLPLIGAFQAMNALCAAALALSLDEDAAAVMAGLDGLRGVPGRMALAGRVAGGGAVYVDYAHTPDALAHALAAVRPHTQGRLHVVFGCGGDRDRGKRGAMGAVASRLADVVFVTDDNPRTEDPASIRRAIVAACPQAVDIGDRRVAIAAAMADLGADDVLVVAGKGHEQGQIVGAEIVPFDDAEVVADLLGGAK